MPARRLTAERRALREFIGAVVAFSGDPGPDNLERYLMQRAPELFNMVRVEELLHLRARGWTFTPYKHHLRIGKLYDDSSFA